MSRQIYVGRLGQKTSREDLQKEFSRYGKIKDIDLRSTHAFIEFEGRDDAKKAISQMDGKRIGGDRITVKSRDNRHLGANGPTARDVCFNCGRKGHWANDCKEGDLRDTCYRCYQKGHLRKDCPKSRTPSVARKSRRDTKKRRSTSSSKSSDSSSKSRRRSRNQRKPRHQRSESPKSSSGSANGSHSSRSSRYFPQLQQLKWLIYTYIYIQYNLHHRYYNYLQFYMIKNTIIHKSKTNVENESEKRIKGILDLEVVEKLQSLNTIQSRKFPNLKKELNAGCIIYNFPIRPQDYKYIYDNKQIPSKLQTIQYDNVSSLDNAKLQRQSSFDNNDQSIMDNSKPLKSKSKRFSINQSISQIQRQILVFNNKNNRFFQTSLRQENKIAQLPPFYLRKKGKIQFIIASQSMSQNQSQNIETKQIEPSRRGKSVSHIISYASRPQTGLPSKENRYLIE